MRKDRIELVIFDVLLGFAFRSKNYKFLLFVCVFEVFQPNVTEINFDFNMRIHMKRSK
jgi:hypothetical protein